MILKNIYKNRCAPTSFSQVPVVPQQGFETNFLYLITINRAIVRGLLERVTGSVTVSQEVTNTMIWSKLLDQAVRPQTKAILLVKDLTVSASVCHLIFSDRATKCLYLKKLFDESESSHLIRVTCGGVSGSANSPQQQSVHSWQELCTYLQNLLTSTIDITLNLLVIENLSQFYWYLKTQPQSHYDQLLVLVNTIRTRFNCTIILTSWDNRFEKGYHSKHTIQPNQCDQLSEVTYLPLDYYHQMDQILYIENKNVYRFQHQWQAVTRDMEYNGI